MFNLIRTAGYTNSKYIELSDRQELKSDNNKYKVWFGVNENFTWLLEV